MSGSAFSENDEKEFISNIDEEKRENFTFLLRNLGNNINAETFFNNNINESLNVITTKSKKSDNEEYFIKNEEINEVKIHLFFILTKNFRYLEDNYTDFFENQYLKTKRLVSQEIIYSGKELYLKEKQYSFLAIKSKDMEIKFIINNNELIYKKEKEKKIGSLMFNKENLLDEKTFLDRYKDFEVDPKTSELRMKKEKSSNLSNKYKNKKDCESKTISTKTDKSENEMKGERFYKIINENRYIRFTYNIYKKEIDGFYNKHTEIKLNTKKINFKDGIEDLKNKYNTNNDLKCHIIYKNFESEIIKEQEPLILEVKASFKIIEILNQIRQASKFFHNLQYDKKYYRKLLLEFYVVMGLLVMNNNLEIYLRVIKMKKNLI